MFATWGQFKDGHLDREALQRDTLAYRARFRTCCTRGSAFVERVLTAAANCRRQGRGVLAFLAATLQAHRAGQPAPSLLPAWPRPPRRTAPSVPYGQFRPQTSGLARVLAENLTPPRVARTQPASAAAPPLAASHRAEPLPPDFILNWQGLSLCRIGATGRARRARRLSWDGFEDLRVEDDRIAGRPWDALDDGWTPFGVDLRTGRTPEDHVRVGGPRWERLAESSAVDQAGGIGAT